MGVVVVVGGGLTNQVSHKMTPPRLENPIKTFYILFVCFDLLSLLSPVLLLPVVSVLV